MKKMGVDVIPEISLHGIHVCAFYLKNKGREQEKK